MKLIEGLQSGAQLDRSQLLHVCRWAPTTSVYTPRVWVCSVQESRVCLPSPLLKSTWARCMPPGGGLRCRCAVHLPPRIDRLSGDLCCANPVLYSMELDRMTLHSECKVHISDVHCSSQTEADYDGCTWCRISSARRWVMNSLTSTTSFWKGPRTTPRGMTSCLLMLHQRFGFNSPLNSLKLVRRQDLLQWAFVYFC